MEHLENYIVGECMDMCPEDEIKMREQQKLLHSFEILPGTENNRLPKADRSRVVKSFSRSAAGKASQNPKHLRPAAVLLKTVGYLLDDVLSRKDVPWRVIYDFIMDRLRSVRQDMVIQNISSAHFISILQPIVRFYVYASYRLCEESIDHFDPHINNTHLQECLKRLLYMYNYHDHLNEVASDFVDTYSDILVDTRPTFEALYLILNLGNPIAITRVLNLPNKWRTDIVEVALELSLCYKSNNYVRACRIIKLLPSLLLMMASLRLPEIRRNAFKVMSTGYSSKNLTVPIQTLKRLLLYETENGVTTNCSYYGLQIKDNGVCFQKNAFNINKPSMPPSRLEFIDEKLANVDISTLVLFGD